ncbi:Short-chain dehydrogenase/reductase SDR [Penicillium rubens]|uniref:Short-chain dehydrogenase/reductase SDR n=1 Tax=Penicillium rubens TaxID=1108849 RepID=UPI002A5AB74C|nr:Short-chain dehydrogenase/reductase SDR [Penicillium rubens]KAJ5829985.1 Short-chain dehydrogenase/reductase SDR [Penicillium rubens]
MSLTSLRNLRTQWFPPKLAFTEKELPSQKGGNAGVGFELCKILYGSGATIHGIKIGGKSPN